MMINYSSMLAVSLPLPRVGRNKSSDDCRCVTAKTCIIVRIY